jgi:hypothetical protein
MASMTRDGIGIYQVRCPKCGSRLEIETFKDGGTIGMTINQEMAHES